MIDKAVILLSGGLDSSTLLHYMKGRLGVKTIYALSFDYGQKHVRELEMAKWQAAQAETAEHRVVAITSFTELLANSSALVGSETTVPDLADLLEEDREQPPTYVPNRNMILLSLAAAYAEAHGASEIFYAAQAQDEYGYWDCTQAFLDRFNKVASLNRRTPVRVQAPFIGMSKAELIKSGLELGVDYSHTWSCYRGKDEPCGTCPTCVERANAFHEAGIPDPLTA